MTLMLYYILITNFSRYHEFSYPLPQKSKLYIKNNREGKILTNKYFNGIFNSEN